MASQVQYIDGMDIFMVRPWALFLGLATPQKVRLIPMIPSMGCKLMVISTRHALWEQKAKAEFFAVLRAEAHT